MSGMDNANYFYIFYLSPPPITQVQIWLNGLPFEIIWGHRRACLPKIFDRIELDPCAWSQCASLARTPRIDDLLGWPCDLDLRSSFGLSLSEPTCIFSWPGIFFGRKKRDSGCIYVTFLASKVIHKKRFRPKRLFGLLWTLEAKPLLQLY